MTRSKNSFGVNRNLNPAISLFVCLFVFALVSQAPAAEWASLKGRFVFDGTPPTPVEITADKDVEVCGKHKLVNEELVVKTLIKSKGVNYLTSGSKNTSDKINLTINPEIIIWGVVTYVIHKQQ